MAGDDPGFKGRQHLFEPVEVATARQAGHDMSRRASVEDASAEPNAKRSVTMKRPRRTTARKDQK